MFDSMRSRLTFWYTGFLALVEEFGKGYTSNGRASSVTVFDLKTLKVLRQIPVGKNPDAILYDPASKRVFTMNGASNDATAIDATAIDAKSDTVAGTIPLEGRPESAVSDERGRVFVNLEDKSAVVEFDPLKLSVPARWPVAPGEEPSGLAIDRQHARLFSTCANKTLVVFDTSTGRVVATLPIGGGVDGATFDPETGLAFTSNGEGTLTVVREDSPDKFSVVENVTTQRGAHARARREDAPRLPRHGRVRPAARADARTAAPAPEHRARLLHASRRRQVNSLVGGGVAAPRHRKVTCRGGEIVRGRLQHAGYVLHPRGVLPSLAHRR